MKSAWRYTRKRRQESKLYKFIWVKELLYKVNFFLWRLWKAKLPLDDLFLKLGYFRTSRCWCCRNTKEETVSHVFLRSPVSKFVYKYFGDPTWINIEGKQLVQVIVEKASEYKFEGIVSCYSGSDSMAFMEEE